MEKAIGVVLPVALETCHNYRNVVDASGDAKHGSNILVRTRGPRRLPDAGRRAGPFPILGSSDIPYSVPSPHGASQNIIRLSGSRSSPNLMEYVCLHAFGICWYPGGGAALQHVQTASTLPDAIWLEVS